MTEQAIGVSGLGGRYATALFELAEETGALDEVAADLAHLRAMLDDSADLRRLVRSPVIAREDQSKAMAALLDRAGAGRLTKNFIGLLAANRRLFALADIIAKFELLRAAARGEITAEVTSAGALTDRQLDALKDQLRRAVGKKVVVRARTDRRLLGGLVVKIGSRMLDTSLGTKIQRLKLAMKGAG